MSCPVCQNPTQPDFKPFCSKACKNRDLLKWMNEGYRIPGPAVDIDALTPETKTEDE